MNAEALAALKGKNASATSSEGALQTGLKEEKEAVAQDSVKVCMKWCVTDADRNVKYLSCLLPTSRYIAVTASGRKSMPDHEKQKLQSGIILKQNWS